MLDHKTLQEIATKYHSNHRKLRYELVEELADKVIMDCRTTAHKFRTRLGSKKCDAILMKEQSVLTKIMSTFEGRNMQTHIMF